MNPGHPESHKTNVSFNGTHKLTCQPVMHDDDDELKEDDNVIDVSSASPLLFLSENSKFDGDPSSSDAGPSSGLSPEPCAALPGSVRVKKTRGKQKINIEFIQEKNKRYTTFSKRKTGLMKKAHELSSLTGAEVLLLVASETNHVYTFATTKLRNMIQSDKGKELIRTCLACDEKPSEPVGLSSAGPQAVSQAPPASLTPPPLPTQQQQQHHHHQHPQQNHQPQQHQQAHMQQPQQQPPPPAVSQAAVLPTSLPHILLPTLDNFPVASFAGAGGGAGGVVPSGYAAEPTGDPAQTILLQIPLHIEAVKKEGTDAKQHPGD